MSQTHNNNNNDNEKKTIGLNFRPKQIGLTKDK